MNSQLSKFFRFGKSDLLVFFFFVCLAGVGATLLLWGKPQNKAEILPQTNQIASNSQEAPLYGNTAAPSAARRSPAARDSLVLSKDYVGPPTSDRSYTNSRKLPEGITLPLNQADSATLTQVPGIGATFAQRIVRYRERLGGFYTLLQLQEVYGMTTEKFQQIYPYFTLGTAPQRIALGTLPYDSLPQHPYLNRGQRNAIARILYRDGKLQGWQQLANLPEFTRDDSIRLGHYFTF